MKRSTYDTIPRDFSPLRAKQCITKSALDDAIIQHIVRDYYYYETLFMICFSISILAVNYSNNWTALDELLNELVIFSLLRWVSCHLLALYLQYPTLLSDHCGRRTVKTGGKMAILD
jgi:hypothetical protein